ncbi:hypothetical protein [Komagataeibacter rhaeticus]|uniref:hypothetical protein n=1 Tax=Komagataeibacter rhaeticus TaxID=215221 RepID=UPI001CD65DE3|nr:hypothetical protein [Komagataeibacter rhaeticus]
MYLDLSPPPFSQLPREVEERLIAKANLADQPESATRIDLTDLSREERRKVLLGL